MRRIPGRRFSRSQAGFTLLEMLVATSIFLVVLYGVYIVYDTGEANYVRSTRNWDVQSQARLALERMAREIRMTGYNVTTNDRIVIATDNTLSFHADVGETENEVAYGTEFITYGLRNCDNAVTQTLYRNASHTSPYTYCGGQPFIDGVTSLKFEYFEQAGVSIPIPASSGLDTVNFVTGTTAPDTSTMTNRNKVRMVKITMTVQQIAGSITAPYTIATDVTLRNLLN